EAMGQYAFIRCFAAGGHGNGKRGVKPAAMLITAIEIKVNIRVDFGTIVDDGGKAATAIEPYVHDVGFLTEMVMAAFGALESRGQEIFGFSGEPDLGAAFVAEEFLQMADGGFVNDGFAAFFTIENRNGYAPGALAGNTP